MHSRSVFELHVHACTYIMGMHVQGDAYDRFLSDRKAATDLNNEASVRDGASAQVGAEGDSGNGTRTFWSNIELFFFFLPGNRACWHDAYPRLRCDAMNTTWEGIIATVFLVKSACLSSKPKYVIISRK